MGLFLKELLPESILWYWLYEVVLLPHHYGRSTIQPFHLVRVSRILLTLLCLAEVTCFIIDFRPHQWRQNPIEFLYLSIAMNCTAIIPRPINLEGCRRGIVVCCACLSVRLAVCDATCNAIIRNPDFNQICTGYASNRASNLLKLWVTWTNIFKVIWPFWI